jgi:hypothetical protein
MIQTRYFTADEFREYTGIDLLEELKGDSNPSDKANRFIAHVEDRVEIYLNSKFFKNVSDLWTNYWNDHNKLLYKKGLMEQAYYVFKNGDLMADSGYDPERGIIVDRHSLIEIAISPAARDYFRMCGIWSGHIGHRGIL